MTRPRRGVLILAVLCVALVGGAGGVRAAGEATIATAVESGPAGLTVDVSGTGFQPGATYGLCLLPPEQVQCGYGGSDLGSFTADAGGNVPGGTRIRVPGVLAGSYRLVATAPGTAAIVASTAFGVIAPSLALDSQAGPGGLVVTVTGSGYGPSAAYTLCIVPTGTPQCGGVGIVLGDVTADGSGTLPDGTKVTIPGQLPATYDVGVMLKGAALPNLIASEPFVEVAPTIAINPASGPGGTTATVTGAGLAPGATYVVCIAPPAASQCGGSGIDLTGFTADAGGAIPDGTSVVIPTGDPGDYPVGIVLDRSAPFLLGSVTFSRTAGTAPPAIATAGPTGPAGSPAGTSPGPPASSVPTVPASADQGPGAFLPLILVALAIVAVIAVGVVLLRRRLQAGRS
ncbi:MAG TPA: hypothetical protein VJ506_05420 [Candidatus Limnocylindrales bacterium]|nr:hypothetical protein [Candidatus Limnocylindrales bacterium]